MAVPVGHSELNLTVVPQPTSTPNWTINVSEIRTIKVDNISTNASKWDITEFFSFSGDIQYVEMQRESETSQLAYVTFKEPQGAEAAILLSGSTFSGLPVTVTPVEDYQLPPEALPLNSENNPSATKTAVKKAEDVVSTMLAKGYVLGKDAINKAKALDEQHHLISNASATVSSIDSKMGLSEKLNMGTAKVNEKLKEVDEQFQVSEKTKTALSVSEQTASNAGSAIMSNRCILTGVTWVSSAFDAVSKAAEDVSTMTKEKIEKAEEEKKEAIFRERAEFINDFSQAHLDSPTAGDPPMLPTDSTDTWAENFLSPLRQPNISLDFHSAPC